MSPNPPAIPVAATSDALRRLVGLRYVVVALLAGSLAAMYFWLALPLPLAPAIVCLAVLLLINGAIHWRLPQPIGEAALFGNLVAEVLALTALFYFVGGSTNPLVSLYLLPLTFAANLLPRRHTWALALLAVVGYSLLLVWYVPLEAAAAAPAAELHDDGAHAGHGTAPDATGGGVHGDLHAGAHGASFGMHVLGMWVIFAVSAGLIAHYLSSLARSLRERDRQLAAAREETLRGERIVALGTLAAGAAHELGTPLATMSVLAEDMALRHGDNEELAADVADLQTQLGRCKEIIGKLADAAGASRGEEVAAQDADRLLEETIANWQLIRPAVAVDYRWQGPSPAPRLVAERTLGQALVNLLNNAADASPGGVEIRAGASEAGVVIDILDRGGGLAPEIAAHAGEPFFTTKAAHGGMGIGLFLANATIERFGGRVLLFNRPEGGACTRVTLPALAPA